MQCHVIFKRVGDGRPYPDHGLRHAAVGGAAAAPGAPRRAGHHQGHAAAGRAARRGLDLLRRPVRPRRGVARASSTSRTACTARCGPPSSSGRPCTRGCSRSRWTRERHTTEAAATARPQARRQLIILAVVVLGLFFAFWYAWSYYQADTSAWPPARPPRPAPRTTPRRRPEDTTVNVYNASNREGLAGSVPEPGRARVRHRQGRQRPLQRKPPNRGDPLRPGGRGTGRAGALHHAQGHRPWSDKREVPTVDVALGPSTRPSPPCPPRSACRCARRRPRLTRDDR